MSHLKPLVTSHTCKSGSEWLVITRVTELFPWHRMSSYCWLSDESLLLLKTSAPEGFVPLPLLPGAFWPNSFKDWLLPVSYILVQIYLFKETFLEPSQPPVTTSFDLVFVFLLTQVTLPYYPFPCRYLEMTSFCLLLSLFRTTLRKPGAQWVCRKYFLNQQIDDRR